ncbi:MAG TPA: hypothetical protein VK590_15365, partial [Saprospiraceae bacterium]|nr:hypothetical protein [Saprospiraceae bacterium]
MSFSHGQKVQLKYTGEIGEVVSNPQMGIVQVMLDGNIKIPVNVEDLEIIRAKEDIKPIIFNNNKVKIEQIPDDRNQHFNIAQLTKTGIHIAFVPQYNKIQEIIHLDTFLINDSISDVLFEFELGDNAILHHQDGILKSCSVYNLGQINKEVIESHESYYLKIAPVLTSGVDEFKLQT